MARLVLAIRHALVTAQDGTRWTTREHEVVKRPQCLAADPLVEGRIYCGTANDGLWISDDSGESWQRAAPVRHSRITAVAVAPAEGRGGKHSVVYVGTEPSAIFRSEDGGEKWEALDALGELASASSWSFPPRPETHHVRSLAADPHHPGRIFACIEAGALVRSEDRGHTWHDRVPGGPYDTHTLVAHPTAPDRLYSAAGDGYFESHDAGTSWRQLEAGLGHPYLVGVAVDPADPSTVLVSAAPHPHRAYDPAHSESAIYRKSRGSDWQQVRDGLPGEKGTAISILMATAPGLFWAANNHGVYRSADAGAHWERLDIPWPDAYKRVNVLSMVLQ